MNNKPRLQAEEDSSMEHKKWQAWPPPPPPIPFFAPEGYFFKVTKMERKEREKMGVGGGEVGRGGGGWRQNKYNLHAISPVKIFFFFFFFKNTWTYHWEWNGERNWLQMRRGRCTTNSMKTTITSVQKTTTRSYNKQSVTAELKEQKQQFKNNQQQMIHGHI